MNIFDFHSALRSPMLSSKEQFFFKTDAGEEEQDINEAEMAQKPIQRASEKLDQLNSELSEHMDRLKESEKQVAVLDNQFRSLAADMSILFKSVADF